MKKNTVLSIALALMLPLVAVAEPQVISRGATGAPTFVQGDLGVIDTLDKLDANGASQDADLYRLAATNFLQDFVIMHLDAAGDEAMIVGKSRLDEVGNVHIRFGQEINGLPVAGAAMMVHAKANTGEVFAVNGDFVANKNLPVAPAIGAERALRGAIRHMGVKGQMLSKPELTYVLTDDGRGASLAWKALVSYTDEVGPQQDWIFSDALTGKLVARHPTFHHAKVLRTYTANNGTSLPGTLRCSSSTCSTGDAAVDAAHNNAGTTYDYYSSKHSRDSLNGSGMTLTSTAHYSSNYNNAFWNGAQMVYGDGDGSTFIALSRSLDVVAHELTHGVTSNESNLTYSNQSGALNEALSDIFGAATEAWDDGGISSNTWKLGEDIYTPGTSGDALRYMNNPTADGQSYDYYPERYTGSSDNGGVHLNSGIANLAFYLMVQGGSHPRGKTSVTVPAIGLTKAEKIFYYAQTSCLTASSNFEAARNCTAQGATNLYGATEAANVHLAWDAVGVPGTPGGGGGGGVLSNGVAKTGLSGSTGSQTFYTISVPSGATNLSFNRSGGSGDADMYVRFGSAPTTSTYDCRPYVGGNSETCSFASPSVGTYHVMIRGYSSYSGVSLVASYTAGGGGGCTPNSGSVTGISGSSGSDNRYTWSVPSCSTKLTVTISGGSGDADLYVKYGSAPTTSSWDCRPYKNGNSETCTFNNPSSGTWHINVRGYSTFSGVTLTVSDQ